MVSTMGHCFRVLMLAVIIVVASVITRKMCSLGQLN